MANSVDLDRICFGSMLFAVTCLSKYRYVLKFSDRQIWANSADPDQTAPLRAVWSESTLLAIPSTSFWRITLRKSHLVKLLGDYSKFSGVRNVRNFTVLQVIKGMPISHWLRSLKPKVLICLWFGQQKSLALPLRAAVAQGKALSLFFFVCVFFRIKKNMCCIFFFIKKKKPIPVKGNIQLLLVFFFFFSYFFVYCSIAAVGSHSNISKLFLF